MANPSESGFAQLFDRIEETLIAVFLGLMTVITFANVVARYVFNDNLLWALEATVFLFAWLVLLGASYAVKQSLHLGIDLLVNALGPAARRALGLVSVAACLAFAVLLLIGSWEYWYPFATKRAFLEVNDIPMPGFLQFLADWFNEGEEYEKMPRFIPYAALPIGMTLLTWRFVQAGIAIARGTQTTVIASHEAAELDRPEG
ncbi:MAG: TRAP transporter small permease [Defluviicoccus sp.]|nr:TRAP transporter small permease [Defluviicoccus sp.]